eukprot:765768-Pelagomonas_calceolata.AAC.12
MSSCPAASSLKQLTAPQLPQSLNNHTHHLCPPALQPPRCGHSRCARFCVRGRCAEGALPRQQPSAHAAMLQAHSPALCMRACAYPCAPSVSE